MKSLIPGENLSAHELASSLNDLESIELYDSYVENYPPELIRKFLAEVMALPDHKIKKSRAALFNYLIRKYGRNNHWN